jgi:hypothetical protein
MSDEKVLTKEIAEQFIADEDSVDLSEFTAIDDDAAESLSKNKGSLDLNGLTSLSDAAAESLSRQAGNLQLIGVTSLSRQQAECLSRHPQVELDSLESIDGLESEPLTEFPDAAEIRIQAKINGWLACNWFEDWPRPGLDLNPENATVLATTFPTDVDLYLHGWFNPLSRDALRLLSVFTGTIHLRLSEVDCEVAEILAGFKARILYLDRFPLNDDGFASSTLTPDTARILLNFSGELRSHGHLADPESETFDILSEHHSIDWGSIHARKVVVVCSLCGDKLLLGECDDVHDESYAIWCEHAETSDWTRDEIAALGWVCDSCNYAYKELNGGT